MERFGRICTLKEGTWIPYYVTERTAAILAARHGGTVERFVMALPGFGIMEEREWKFYPDKNAVADCNGVEWKIEGD